MSRTNDPSRGSRSIVTLPIYGPDIVFYLSFELIIIFYKSDHLDLSQQYLSNEQIK